jgi:hypothetical protein
MELHRTTGEALAHTVDDQGKDNPRLKKRIAKLEVSLSPRPLFAKPLSIIHLMEVSLSHP